MMLAVAPMDTDRSEFIADQLRRHCRSGIRLDEPMSRHTTIGAGGPARFFAVPERPKEIIGLVRAALRLGVDYLGIGRGSNLLVRDGGFDGLLIRVAGNLGAIDVRKRTVYAESGVSFTRLGRVVTKAGRPGFEFAIGIPGSVGGAVRMNAGAYGSELARVVKSVRIIDETGRIEVLAPDRLGFGYRNSALADRAIVLSAIFHCPPGAVDRARLEKSLSRKDSQPLAHRSFGSTFRNPPGGFAAKLIEECGLKGTRRGGAVISEKHANFIVNLGENTHANDIEDLILHVIGAVEARFGVTLKPEVVIVGNR